MTASFSLLSLEDTAGIESFLRKQKWIDEGDRVVSMEKAGEGNMNLVVRVTTSRGSHILKQSRPWVEKYPSIAAPGDRLLVEAQFYEAVSESAAVALGMPRLLAVNEAARAAWIEDLGTAADCTDVYGGAGLDVASLVRWLTALHGIETVEPPIRNREMRALNHAHIFDLPMSGAHGMDLDTITEGLQSTAVSFRADDEVQAAVKAAGELYLSDGKHLLHGDYYPGSWLRTSEGVRVIDPEFCFLGPKEFDLGVLQAHLLMADWSPARVAQALAGYALPHDSALRHRFAGIEIMRRLIGVAQLPLDRKLVQKSQLLDLARGLILA